MDRITDICDSRVAIATENKIVLIAGVTVESRDCGGPLLEGVRYDMCSRRQLGGGAQVMVCHCLQDGCNVDSLASFSEFTAWTWWDSFLGVLGSTL